MKRLILGATLTLLLIPGLFRPQFIPVTAPAPAIAEDTSPVTQAGPAPAQPSPPQPAQPRGGTTQPSIQQLAQSQQISVKRTLLRPLENPPPVNTDLPTINLFEEFLNDINNFFLRDAVIRLEDAKTGKPMANVPVKVEPVQPHASTRYAESLSLESDEQGFVKFLYPYQAPPIRVSRGGENQRRLVYDILIRIEPLQRDGHIFLAGKDSFALHFQFRESNSVVQSNTWFLQREDQFIIPMQEGHLFVGRVMNAKTNQPFAKSDDGKPVRVAFTDSSWNKEGHPQAGSPVLEADDNGIFQCYLPEGVCWPFILPNGNDQIWPRTENYQQWQKEGVLIRPGKITTVKFRVTPRLDANAAAPPLPVLEEQLAAAKLTMLGGSYELDENRRVQKASINWDNPPLKKQWLLIREFKHLTTLDFRHFPVALGLSYCPALEITEDDIQQILELPALTTLIVFSNPKHGVYHDEVTIEGRENIEKYFREEFPEIRAWLEKNWPPMFSPGQGGMMGVSPEGSMMPYRQ